MPEQCARSQARARGWSGLTIDGTGRPARKSTALRAVCTGRSCIASGENHAACGVSSTLSKVRRRESAGSGSAALDVYATEPLPADSRLRALDNVLLTPHAAWFSPEAMQDLPVHTARNAVDFLAGRPVPSIVNPDHARALA